MSGIKKSDGTRLALKSIRQTSRVALFATAAGLAYDSKSWVAGVWTPEKRKRPLRFERHKKIPYPIEWIRDFYTWIVQIHMEQWSLGGSNP
ncbi:hypothetical protein DP120_14480 [Planococcus halotolerans]|uniref:Uncharacterized protein n=1 Tax=Planococcus halotolerans TaxID=2233542 RepID=A0A365KR38_9BACL|nr:hypothetical protein DP120_14480 [Planococcus halotolerans]